MCVLSWIMKNKLTDLGFSVTRSVSDKTKNKYGNRLISLYHSLGLYIVNSRVRKCDRPYIPCFSTTDV